MLQEVTYWNVSLQEHLFDALCIVVEMQFGMQDIFLFRHRKKK